MFIADLVCADGQPVGATNNSMMGLPLINHVPNQNVSFSHALVFLLYICNILSKPSISKTHLKQPETTQI